MAIKMRHNKDKEAFCCECGSGQDDSLGMYDICIGGTILTICDVCNEKIFSKCLSAEVEKNHRTKTAADMRIIRKRQNGTYVNWGELE